MRRGSGLPFLYSSLSSPLKGSAHQLLLNYFPAREQGPHSHCPPGGVPSIPLCRGPLLTHLHRRRVSCVWGSHSRGSTERAQSLAPFLWLSNQLESHFLRREGQAQTALGVGCCLRRKHSSGSSAQGPASVSPAAGTWLACVRDPAPRSVTGSQLPGSLDHGSAA